MGDRLTVVFDLDETLIHGSQSIPAEWADFMSGPYRCKIRPHAMDLIDECLRKYTVGIWTSAGVHHATSVVEALFDDPERLHFVWSAKRCTDWRDFELNEMVSIKDLRKLKRLGLDLNRIVAIDDSPKKHQRNFGNLLRVRPWTANKKTPHFSTLPSTSTGSPHNPACAPSKSGAGEIKPTGDSPPTEP